MTVFPNQTVTAVTETTPTGTAYERTTLTLGSGDVALLTAPTSKPLGSAVTVVIACHGFQGSNNTFEVHAPSLGIRDRMTDDGYVFIAPNMHGDTWANQVALTDLASAYAYAAANWDVQNVLLFGGSMGGLAVVQAASRGTVPNVRAVAAVAPALNLSVNYSKAAYKSSIATAYGIAADGSDYAAKTAGFDPILHTASQYAGGKFRFYHSPDDVDITKAAASDLFVSNGLTAQMAEFQLLTTSGGHLSAGNYNPADTSAFYAAALPAPPPDPGLPGSPAPILASRAWDGSAWVETTPRVWDGSAWVVAQMTGYVPA